MPLSFVPVATGSGGDEGTADGGGRSRATRGILMIAICLPSVSLEGRHAGGVSVRYFHICTYAYFDVCGAGGQADGVCRSGSVLLSELLMVPCLFLMLVIREMDKHRVETGRRIVYFQGLSLPADSGRLAFVGSAFAAHPEY
jgi:hypothetical protein